MSELRDLASRLVSVYEGSKRFEELKSPGLARKAQELARNDPDTYARIATDLADGLPVTKIAKLRRAAPELVRFIRAMHPELAHAARSQLVANLEEASVAMAQRLVAEVTQLNLDKLPQALSTVLDKLALLTGGVTQRTEHLSAPKPEDIKRMFEDLPRAKTE